MLTATITAAVFFAFFIERAIEKFVSQPYRQPWLVLAAIGAGIVAAIGFNVDVITALLAEIPGGAAFTPGIVPYLGHVITGVAIGFGSTFVHDVTKKG